MAVSGVERLEIERTTVARERNLHDGLKRAVPPLQRHPAVALDDPAPALVIEGFTAAPASAASIGIYMPLVKRPPLQRPLDKALQPCAGDALRQRHRCDRGEERLEEEASFHGGILRRCRQHHKPGHRLPETRFLHRDGQQQMPDRGSRGGAHGPAGSFFVSRSINVRLPSAESLLDSVGRRRNFIMASMQPRCVPISHLSRKASTPTRIAF